MKTVLVVDDDPDIRALITWKLTLAGIEACEALRADPLTADMPIILLTARAQQDELAQGLAAGADDYIVKPFSPGELLLRVNDLLARADARRN